MITRAEDKEHGFGVKPLLVRIAREFEKKQFSSPRVSGMAKITPFEVNVRATKRIQSIGKVVTALVDFCACRNLSHRGLHRGTFQRHSKTFVRACENSASSSEVASVAVMKKLYADFANPIANVVVLFDRSWMTRGCSSHIGVGCIIQLHSSLVFNRAVYSNWDQTEAGVQQLVFGPECRRNIDCNAGCTQVQAALTMFRRSLAKQGLR